MSTPKPYEDNEAIFEEWYRTFEGSSHTPRASAAAAFHAGMRALTAKINAALTPAQTEDAKVFVAEEGWRSQCFVQFAPRWGWYVVSNIPGQPGMYLLPTGHWSANMIDMSNPARVAHQIEDACFHSEESAREALRKAPPPQPTTKGSPHESANPQAAEAGKPTVQASSALRTLVAMAHPRGGPQAKKEAAVVDGAICFECGSAHLEPHKPGYRCTVSAKGTTPCPPNTGKDSSTQSTPSSCSSSSPSQDSQRGASLDRSLAGSSPASPPRGGAGGNPSGSAVLGAGSDSTGGVMTPDLPNTSPTSSGSKSVSATAAQNASPNASAAATASPDAGLIDQGWNVWAHLQNARCGEQGRIIAQAIASELARAREGWQRDLSRAVHDGAAARREVEELRKDDQVWREQSCRLQGTIENLRHELATLREAAGKWEGRRIVATSTNRDGTTALVLAAPDAKPEGKDEGTRAVETPALDTLRRIKDKDGSMSTNGMAILELDARVRRLEKP